MGQPPVSRQMYLTSVNASMPRREPSRPSPDCLNPPKGTGAPVTFARFTAIMPYCSALVAPIYALGISGLDVGDQAVFRVVGTKERLFFVEEDDGGDRAEGLLLQDTRRRRHVRKHGWREEERSRPVEAAPVRQRAPRSIASLTCAICLAIAFVFISGPTSGSSMPGPTTRAAVAPQSGGRILHRLDGRQGTG